MTPHEYQRETRRTRPAGASREDEFANYTTGLASEAGELAGVVYKHCFYGQPLDREKIVKEAGDALWFLTSLLDVCGASLDEARATPATYFVPKEGRGPALAQAARAFDRYCECAVDRAWRIHDSGPHRAFMLIYAAADALRALEYIASAVGATLDEVMAANVVKLRTRYPQGWTAADAAERKDEGMTARHAPGLTLLEAELLDALEAMVAEQNGPPLPGRHERAWREAMAKAEAAIAKAKKHGHVRLAHRLPLYTRDPEAARMVAALGDLSEADEATLLRCAHLARAIADNVGFKLERGSDGFVLTFDSVRGRLPEWYGRPLPAYRLLSKLLMLAMDAKTYHSYCGNPDVVQRLGLAIEAIEPTDFELQWLKDTARRFGDRPTAERSIEASRGYVVDKYWCVGAIGRLFRSPQEGPVEWEFL